MARYIDADAMLSKVKVNDDLVGKIDGKTLKAWINSQPTVDVVPVIRAHWIERQLSGYGEYEFCCSNCENINYGYDTPGNYCNNCGAKMDEEVE